MKWLFTILFTYSGRMLPAPDFVYRKNEGLAG